MLEREVAVREAEEIQDFIRQLRDAVALETTEEGCDQARWGQFSHDWNKPQRAFLAGLQTCIVRSRLHGRVHRAAFQLFPAWQQIHYTITYGRPAETDKLDALERDLKELLKGCQT